MFKSKIFIKAMLIVSITILAFAFTLSFFILPEIETSIKNLEEKNAKKTLSEVVSKINIVHNEIEAFKKVYLEQNQKKLVNLTETMWSLIQTKYNQSKIENIGEVLKNRTLEFEKNLMAFYNQNKNKMSEEQLKNTIKKFIEIYRYNKGNGYYWVNEYKTSKMVMHPISPNLIGLKMNNHLNIDGINVYKEMLKSLSNKDNKGVLKYRWLNPNSGKIEEKISYVFLFEPFNWLIGTGEYFSVLKEKLQNDVFELINKVRYEKDNYFFILDYDSVLLSHPYLQGKDFSNIRDKEGNLIAPNLIKTAKQKGEGFYTYWWRKDINAPYFKKISFVKDFPDWEMIIGTGIHVNLIEEEIKKKKEELLKELRQIIRTTRFGKTGYLYIMTKSGKMLIHPNKQLDDKDISKLLNPVSKTYMYDELVKGYESEDKAFYYIWNKPSDINNYVYEKVSWVEYIPQFEWYVASSIYTEELKESATQMRNYIIILTIIVLIITFLVSFVFFKNLLAPLNKLTYLVRKASSGDYSGRFIINDKSDEISLLANKFNEMLQTIEKRTEELQSSNDELEQMIYNLKTTQKKLIEVEKMASLGKLVSGVAHEVNTPIGLGLTASSHFSYLTEILNDKYKKEEMTEEDFDEYIKEAMNLSSMIFSNLTRASDIIKSFKQVAIDQETEKKRIFNLREYIQGIFYSMDSIIKKENIKVDIKCDDITEVNSYPGLLYQALTNLIMNSIKHGFRLKENGKITIEASVENNRLSLVYIDDGKGIKKEDLPKIFEHFFTTNREEGGTGLGLNIVYNIITNNLKGTISCDSEVDKGVVFKIEIPFDKIERNGV